MTFQMPTTREEFESLPDIEKLVALAHVLSESADRCETNMLFRGTWIQDTFGSAAIDLKTTAYRVGFELDILKRQLAASTATM